MPSSRLSAAPWPHVVVDWYRENARDLPWRRPEFQREYGAWGTLVSEFMLQQTPVTRVIPHLNAWLARWPTPSALAQASPADVVTQWANLGYPRRALWLRGAAVAITEKHGGVVPADVNALLELPGIGDYTARAVAVFSYGQRHPVVDTNTRRVIARQVIGTAQPGPAARSDLTVMEQLLPRGDDDAALFNAAAMELGAVVCTARSPRCEMCPVTSTCAWLIAGRPESEDRRVKQARYVGSDRQTRGAILKVLREHRRTAVPAAQVIADWPDPLQRDRAIDSLVADGLIEIRDGQLTLPR